MSEPFLSWKIFLFRLLVILASLDYAMALSLMRRGKRVLVWVGYGGGIGFPTLHKASICENDSFTSGGALLVFFLYGTSLCNAYNGGGWVGVSAEFFVLCSFCFAFCSLHFNNDVHFYVVRQKEGRG